MSFNVIFNSTVADNTEMNNNFYTAAQGNRLPRGGDTLKATDSVYDLGSSTTTWDHLYCDNLYPDNITTLDKSLWILGSEFTIAAATTLTEITGLDGDSEKQYLIVADAKLPAGASGDLEMKIQFNTDLFAETHFYYHYLQNDDGVRVVGGDSSSAIACFKIENTTGQSSSGFAYIQISVGDNSVPLEKYFQTIHSQMMENIQSETVHNMWDIFYVINEGNIIGDKNISKIQLLTTTQAPIGIRFFRRG